MTTQATTRPSLDDLDNYHVDDLDDDPFRSPSPQPAKGSQSDASKKRKTDDLGIDEEVDLTKRARVPRVKLDETKLLSDNGIPKLRKRARDLKFKGKGHEFSDAARLLSFYQFWLDDLFPKAKFVDALAMVEKTGHKRILAAKRMEWINEGKPKSDVLADDDDDDEQALPPLQNAPGTASPANNGTFTDGDDRPATPRGATDDHDDVPDEEDLFGATPIRPKPTTASRPPNGQSTPAEDEEDDLDALMAEAEGAAFRNNPEGRGEDEDDLDALMAEAEADAQRQSKQIGASHRPAADDIPPDGEFADDEAAMAEMGGLW